MKMEEPPGRGSLGPWAPPEERHPVQEQHDWTGTNELRRKPVKGQDLPVSPEFLHSCKCKVSPPGGARELPEWQAQRRAGTCRGGRSLWPFGEKPASLLHKETKWRDWASPGGTWGQGPSGQPSMEPGHTHVWEVDGAGQGLHPPGRPWVPVGPRVAQVPGWSWLRSVSPHRVHHLEQHSPGCTPPQRRPLFYGNWLPPLRRPNWWSVLLARHWFSLETGHPPGLYTSAVPSGAREGSWPPRNVLPATWLWGSCVVSAEADQMPETRPRPPWVSPGGPGYVHPRLFSQ